MSPRLPFATPLVRCGGCGGPPERDRPLRRGRCARCYDVWVRSRQVGVGASCTACGDRRYDHLRHFEIGMPYHGPGGRWTVLCNNCAGAAEQLDPAPRSVDALRMRLQRDRRWGDRRAPGLAAEGALASTLSAFERRSDDRRVALRDLFDATDLAVLLDDDLEDPIEVDRDDVTEELRLALDEVTAIHARLDA